jgi:hypothetical protein
VVIGIAAHAVRKQVAVVVPGVGLPVDAGEAIGGVVLIVYHAPTRCQAQALADMHSPEAVEGQGKGGQLHVRPKN